MKSSWQDARVLFRGLAKGVQKVTAGSKRSGPSGGIEFDLSFRPDGGERETIRVEVRWSAVDARADAAERADGAERADAAERPRAVETEEPRQERHAKGAIDLAQALESLSRERLYELAQQAEVRGRSSMDKAALIEQLAQSLTLNDLTREDLAQVNEARGQEVSRGASREQLLARLDSA